MLPYDGQALLYPEFAIHIAMEDVRDEVSWVEESIRLFGKVHKVPRLIAYYGDVGYQYSGVWHPAVPMPQVLSQLQRKIAEVVDFTFNSVLCNYYRHGMDGMGYHRDNEPELDASCIASLSFGTRRRFRMRHRRTKESVAMELGQGDLLIMLDCQDEWEHAIPKTKKPCGERINLTYRRIFEAS